MFSKSMLDDNNDLEEGAGDSISKQDRRSSESGWYPSRKARAASSLSSSPSSPPFPPRERSASSPLLPQLRSAGRRLSFGKSSPWADRTSRESSQEGAVCAKLQDGSVSPKRVTEDGPQSPMCGERIGNYTVVRMVGQGGEGSIYLVVHEESGKDVELILKRRVFLSFADGNAGLQEVLAMAKVKSPFCVALTNVFQVELNGGSFALCLVMGYCPNGDLLRKLVRIMDGKEPKLSPQQVKAILYDLIRGLEAIHEAGFTHRDVKLENILLDRNDRVKIGDFGLAYPALSNLKGCVGSSQYSPPEMEMDRNGLYCCAVDLWALGVIALELAGGYVWMSKHPVEKLGMIAAMDAAFDPSKWVDLDLPLDMRHEVGPLVVLLLQRDPKRRPACSALAQSAFFEDFKRM